MRVSTDGIILGNPAPETPLFSFKFKGAVGLENPKDSWPAPSPGPEASRVQLSMLFAREVLEFFRALKPLSKLHAL